MIRVATDVGGTFTDFAAFDDDASQFVIAKTLSTEKIVDAVVQCFANAGMDAGAVDHFIHGNTVAINTVIERSGARTGLLTTRGFRDILELQRGNIRNSFDLMFQTPEPLVPRHLRLEVDERMVAGGRELEPLDTEQARHAIRELMAQEVEAVAICLLHAYANPDHEEALRELVAEENAHVFVAVSSELLRQYREFERSSTAVLSAYVGPRVGSFFDHLGGFLEGAGFEGSALVMQSNGGTMTIDAARRQPVRTMESGPVGGTIAAAAIGREMGLDNVVAFDMGGTTAKVSIVKNGRVEIADGYAIGGEETGYPLQLPVVDILEVGSGGGSIAHVDETGLLKVGPLSAGSAPGPACYANGGTRPTITDADAVMGRLNPDFFLGGEIALDVEAARAAIEAEVAEPLGLDTLRAAFGIAQVADTNMSHALRIMTVQKGHDPREFALIAFGGAGPGHAATVARELGIGSVIVPPHPGIFSAIGMLLADAKDEHVQSYVRKFEELDAAEPEALFAEMMARGRADMEASGFAAGEVTVSRSVEMRYQGQEFTLLLDLAEDDFSPASLASLRARFDELHELRYGHAFAAASPEFVSLRLHVVGLLAKPELNLAATDGQAKSTQPMGQRPVYFERSGFVDCPVYRRDALAGDTVIEGPAIVEEVMSTTVVHSGDKLEQDRMGNLVIRLGD